MKKYVKPMITLEQFELSQNIADCAWELTNADEHQCSAKPDDDFFYGAYNGNLFTESTTGGCRFIPGVNYEGYCYQASTGNTFKS